MTKRPAVLVLVEDSDDDAYLAEQAIRDDKLINRVIRLRNGQEALDYLRDCSEGECPDLILLDLHMPVMDGREFLERAKEAGHLGQIPVIVFTASEDERVRAQLDDLGATAYVVKPMDLMAFRDVVRSVADYWLEIVLKYNGA